MTLGDKIKQLRKGKGLSQEKLAQRLDTAKSVIWKYEKNEAVPSAEVVKRIALEFEVSADYLLFGETEKENLTSISDKKLLKQFEEIDKFDEAEKEHIRYFLELAINNRKIKKMTV
ncbi:MAG: helix-turn-helix transcriptional regulator [bacterium]|nr:helix-turn-helix transcriptional regulator [bacterium]